MAKAPCKPWEGEVEINGGRWVALEKKPPCLEYQAEHQGKCYLPALRSREPQTLDPAAHPRRRGLAGSVRHSTTAHRRDAGCWAITRSESAKAGRQ